jgi:K+-transporting ATPase A subunit
VVYRPFGDYMYRVVSGARSSVVERGIHRLVGVDRNAEQTWGVYARSVLAFSAVSILFLYLLLRLQGSPAIGSHLAWNTAVSFVTNTNWQSYSGESTMTYLSQMAGLAVQNFVSAAVGIAVAMALVRGFAARRAATLGNFWVDLTRITLRVLLPVALIGCLVFMVGGMVQNLSGGTDVTTLTGATQHIPGGTVPQAVGAAMEGKEVRFGVPNSATFAAATTLTSTGAVDSFHDSYTAFGGMMPMLDMMLGEVAPGGVGSGLYGLLILAVITVFVAGLMVGRTPEYLGKKINALQIKLASLYFLVTPALVLIGTAAAFATGNNGTALNTGPHGLSEVRYAFTSAANNNGSAFAGITVNTPWWDTALGLAMLLGRFLPLVLVLALAGSLARQRSVPASEGTLPTHRPLFVGMVAAVTIVLVALTFLPALTLGPIAEGLS